MMIHAGAQFACLGQYVERVYPADTLDFSHKLIHALVSEPRIGQPLNLVTLSDKTATLHDAYVEIDSSGVVLRNRRCIEAGTMPEQ